MSIGLTASQLTRLQAALTILLSPLDYESVGEWRTNARKSIQALLGADSSLSLLQVSGDPPFDTDDISAMVEYGAYYHQFDRVNRYRELGTVAFTWDTISHLWERPSREKWLRSEFYNDWVLRHRLCQPRGLNVVLPPGQPMTGLPAGEDLAALYFYQDRESPRIDDNQQLAILRTLLRPFIAGTHIAQRVGALRLVEPLAGALEEGIALYDGYGRVVYQNARFRQLLAEDPEATGVERTCARLARTVLAVAAPGGKSRQQELIAPGPHAVRTQRTAYNLRGAHIAPGVLAHGPMAVVALGRSAGPSAADWEKARRAYRLTAREVAVAQLLASGYSNEQVARQLGISIHTTRRHVEHILSKLGVHSRAAVGAKLWDALRGRSAYT